MSDEMNAIQVEQAFSRLGFLVRYHEDIEILLVGGAAGTVTGLLSANRTTTDCDIMVYMPPWAMAVVERAAEQVASELGLAARWLNSDVQLRRDALPDGWEQRRMYVGIYGRLRVSAISRVDLIAMKVLAGRAQDLEDLEVMRIRIDEREFVRRYLDALLEKGTTGEQINDAREVLDSLRLYDHE